MNEQHRPKPLIVAHRGASGLAAENTLAAFQLAIALGADGIEFDVQLTADRRAVVIHDSRLNRTTNAAGRVSELNASEIERIDASSWFDERLKARPRLRASVETLRALTSPDEHNGLGSVPSLERVLNVLSNSGLKRVFIELKGSQRQTRALLPIVTDLVRNFRLEKTVTILSFDHRVIEQARLAHDSIRTGALFSIASRTAISTRSIMRQVERIGAHEAALHFGLASPRLVDALHHRNISVCIWTVNRRMLMRRFAWSEVDAIMTNFPNRLAELVHAPVSAGLTSSRLRDRKSLRQALRRARRSF